MANRKWRMGFSMGYAGTRSEWEIDLVDDYNYTLEEVEIMSNDEVREMLSDDAYQQASEKIGAWSEPI